MFIVILIFTFPIIITTIFVWIFLLKKYPRITVVVLAFICVIALFTKPSEETYFNALTTKHGLQCNEHTGTCIADQHVYTIQQFSSHNLGLFTTYHLKMTYGGGTHLREIDSIGAFHTIFTYTNR